MKALQRLNDALKSLFLSNSCPRKKDWADFLEVDYGYLCGITTGKEKLSDSFLVLVQNKLGLNSNWVLTGEGDMLIDTPEDSSKNLSIPTEPKKNFETVLNLIKALNFPNFRKLAAAIGYANTQLIYDLNSGKAQKIPGDFISKVCAKFPEVNVRYLMYGEGEILTDGNISHGVLREPEEPFSVGRISEAVVEQYPNDTPMSVRQGKLYSVDMETLGMVTLRDYYAQNSPADKAADSAMPPRTIIYQTHTNLLKRWGILKYDWLTLQLIQDHSKLINGKVYLVVYEKGIMIKRLEIEEDHYILSLPVKRPDYPDLKVSATVKMHFYDIVSRITTNIGNMIDESDDGDYLARACVEANKHLLINEQKAHDNTAAALKIIDKLTGK